MTDFTYQSHLENKPLFRKLDIEGQGGVRTPATPWEEESLVTSGKWKISFMTSTVYICVSKALTVQVKTCLYYRPLSNWNLTVLSKSILHTSTFIKSLKAYLIK